MAQILSFTKSENLKLKFVKGTNAVELSSEDKNVVIDINESERFLTALLQYKKQNPNVISRRSGHFWQRRTYNHSG